MKENVTKGVVLLLSMLFYVDGNGIQFGKGLFRCSPFCSMLMEMEDNLTKGVVSFLSLLFCGATSS